MEEIYEEFFFFFVHSRSNDEQTSHSISFVSPLLYYKCFVHHVFFSLTKIIHTMNKFSIFCIGIPTLFTGNEMNKMCIGNFFHPKWLDVCWAEQLFDNFQAAFPATMHTNEWENFKLENERVFFLWCFQICFLVCEFSLSFQTTSDSSVFSGRLFHKYFFLFI